MKTRENTPLEYTPLDEMIVEAGLGYWTTIGYKTGKPVQPYVRLNDNVDMNKVQELVNEYKEIKKYNL